MKRFGVFIVLVVCTTGGLMSCSSNDPAKTARRPSYAFLRHVDQGCTSGAESSSGETPYDCYLAGHETRGDTLALLIHFQANCCPDFIEAVAIGQGTIDIELTDGLEGCRCFCDFENEFVFYWPSAGNVAVGFSNKGAAGAVICEFDTVITLE